jgi:hypothetical protein
VSCVELAEDAWEAAGINISLIPDELLSPHDQFLRTTPVIEINARAGEEIRIPIIGASRVEETFTYVTGRLTNVPGSRVGMDLRVTAEPDVFAGGRATLEPTTSPQALQDLVFKPTNEDAKETTQFKFELSVPSGPKLAPHRSLSRWRRRRRRPQQRTAMSSSTRRLSPGSIGAGTTARSPGKRGAHSSLR